MKMNIAVIFGGRSGEYEVSLQSAAAIISALDQERYHIWPIAIAKDGTWYAPVADAASFDPANYRGQEALLLPRPGGYLQRPTGEVLVQLDVVLDIVHGTTG